MNVRTNGLQGSQLTVSCPMLQHYYPAPAPPAPPAPPTARRMVTIPPAPPAQARRLHAGATHPARRAAACCLPCRCCCWRACALRQRRGCPPARLASERTGTHEFGRNGCATAGAPACARAPSLARAQCLRTPPLPPPLSPLSPLSPPQLPQQRRRLRESGARRRGPGRCQRAPGAMPWACARGQATTGAAREGPSLQRGSA